LNSFFSIPLFARAHPNGLDLAHDLSEQGIKPQTILDVGANVGQSAYEYHTRWPKAEIYCFEPVQETFTQLIENVGSYAHCVQRACSAEKGAETIYVHPDDSGQSSLHKTRGREEKIKKTTLDGFACEHEIENVDLLKIDVEGHELKVLGGAINLIKDSKIKSIFIEVGFSGSYYVPLNDIASVLKSQGFHLVSLHDQWTNPQTGKLQHANALWVRSTE
jgi:FkbM family methyltransferase